MKLVAEILADLSAAIAAGTAALLAIVSGLFP